MEIKKEIENIKREWIEGDSDYTTLCLTKGYSLGIKESAEIIEPNGDGVISCYCPMYQAPCGDCFGCRRWKLKLKVLSLLDEPNFKKEE